MLRDTGARRSRFIFGFGSFLLIGSVSVPDPLSAQSCPDFNCFLRAAAEDIVRDPSNGGRGNLGWCEGGTFTRDLTYMGTGATISRKPVHPCKGNNNATSCNGAVFEILIEALNRYSRQPGSTPVTIPAATWQNSTLDHLRANIFMYEPREMPPFSGHTYKIPDPDRKKKKIWYFTFNKDSKLQDFSEDLRNKIRAFESRSIAHALNRFGFADSIKAAEMKLGDVLTFNRDVKEVLNGIQTDVPTGTQHSVIFMGWVGQDQKDAASFDSAKGFKYISSQSNPKSSSGEKRSGFGLRWAYFSNFCPQDPENTVALGDKYSCPDQRKDDNGGDGPNYPKQLPGQKSDCCVIRKDGGLTKEGLKAGRLREPSTWGASFNETAQRIQNDLGELEARAKQEKAAWLQTKRQEVAASIASTIQVVPISEIRRFAPSREFTSQ